jgi:hypothetical protein
MLSSCRDTNRFTHGLLTWAQLELDSDDGASVFERMTLTYGLGDQHGLFETMNSAQTELTEV